MSTAYLTEYRGTAPQAGVTNPVPLGPPLNSRAVTYATATSYTLNPQCTLARIVNSSSAFHWTIADKDGSATAVTGAAYVPANTVEYIGAPQGGAKISFWDGTST